MEGLEGLDADAEAPADTEQYELWPQLAHSPASVALWQSDCGFAPEVGSHWAGLMPQPAQLPASPAVPQSEAGDTPLVTAQ